MPLHINAHLSLACRCKLLTSTVVAAQHIWFGRHTVLPFPLPTACSCCSFYSCDWVNREVSEIAWQVGGFVGASDWWKFNDNSFAHLPFCTTTLVVVAFIITVKCAPNNIWAKSILAIVLQARMRVYICVSICVALPTVLCVCMYSYCAKMN